jgi:hypothetical protein
MKKKKALREHALDYHRHLPEGIWEHLRGLGFSDELIHRRLLGWDGKRITVPVWNEDRQLAYFTYLTDPNEGPITDVIRSDRFTPAALYGIEELAAIPSRIIIVRGAWDKLVLDSRGFKAIAVLGDPRSFKELWAEAFRGIGQVFVSFPRSGTGHRGARRVAEVVPGARIVELPDITGHEETLARYFLDHGHSREDYLRLLLIAGMRVPRDFGKQEKKDDEKKA